MKLLRASLLLSVFAASLLAGASPALASGSTQRVNLTYSHVQADADSWGGAISPDGSYVAFSSIATNVVAGDTNNSRDIFLRDGLAGTVARVSVDSAGGQVAGQSDSADISSGGAVVSFRSYAANLVAGDTNGMPDIFVRDLQSGTTSRISVDSAGNQGNGIAGAHAISADGRYVAFQSESSNLAPEDTDDDWDIFVHDRQTGMTTLASLSSGGIAGNSASMAPDVSGDGRYVVFSSAASNLTAGDTNGLYDEFVRDRQTGTTTLVSVGMGGAAANGNTFSGSISEDGRWVAFASTASNLVAGDTNGKMDVYLRDMQIGVTTRVSGSGAQGNGDSSQAALSADGHFVSFTSAASDLTAGDTNAVQDVFRYDRQTGTTVRVSVNSSGNQGNKASGPASISSDGARIVFDSFACNLVMGDTNSARDVFLHNLNDIGGGASPNADSDCDGVPDNVDNCIDVANSDQWDWDGDGVGDACDVFGAVDNLSVDMNDDASPANLPLSIGSVERCGIILDDGVLNGDEDEVDSLTVDIVVGPLGVPESNPVIGYQFQLGYDSAEVRVTAKDNAQMLSAAIGSDVLDVGDPVPDADGDLLVAALDLNVSPEFGDGVLTRLTLEGIGQGISRLNLANAILIDPGNNVVMADSLDGATIVVGPVSEPNPCADADSDGVTDAIDNCPADANEDQLDNESDGLGDVCDPDDDNAGVYDVDEIACGADPLIAVIRPERTDVVFTGVDDDGDGLSDEPTPGGSSSFDCDGDGYKGDAEAGTPLCGNSVNDDGVVFGGSDDGVVDDGCPGGPPAAGAYSEAQFNIGTVDQDPCGNNGWPAELAGNDNKVTLADITSFTSPAPRKFNTSPGVGSPYNQRWDLVPGGGGGTWIVLSDITSLTAGPASRPAVLEGARAFNGPACPWAP